MPSPSPTQRHDSGSAGAAEQINILLVDDQPARLMSYESILVELGHRLVRASSGLEALERLMKDEYAVILLDVSMPGMDGFETASLIHEHPRFERTPIIFVTGVNVSELDQLKGYKVGAVDYVHVPVVPEILRSKVSVLVELYCKRRELQALNQALGRMNQELAAANRELQLDKARELEALNRHLKRANAELESTNRALQAEVTERARIEQQLKAADRHKDEFLAMLAHELRNPLAPIRNAVHIMRTKPAVDPQLAWVQEVIDRQLGSLTRLVDDLLDVSRITRGKINIFREPLELGAILHRAVETVQPLIDEKRHQLTIELPDPGLILEGDLTRLTQVVANILANAAKYTEEGGHIVVSGVQAGEDVEIRICDDGIGMAPGDLPRIFELFTQAGPGAHSGLGGLGIGLALVRRLVELHGGTVSARSDGPGRGSEIAVRLPRIGRPKSHARSAIAIREALPTPEVPLSAGAPPSSEVASIPEALPVPAAPAPVDAEGSRSGRRILIVDDNRDALESLAALMEMSGHVVQTAFDGEDALRVAQRCRPEVVLLDLGLPKLDGYEVARRMRKEPWGRGAMLVALTGWGQDEDRRRTRESGFDAHMVKPLDLDELMRLLEPGRIADSSDAARH